jgi:hypothetical protein
MRLFDLAIQGEHSGPHTTNEIVELLERYRRDHPEDDQFSKVQVIEIPEHGTVGTERSVFDFIPEHH